MRWCANAATAEVPTISATSLPCIDRGAQPKRICASRECQAKSAQVDWGHFGHLQIGRARRALMAFVMVLSWSRQVFVQFFLDARMESFLRGHIAAFAAWNGLPRILLYDNLR